MITIRVKLIQNNQNWPSLREKADEIEDFYNQNPDINLVIDTGHTEFPDIPFENTLALTQDFTNTSNPVYATTPTIPLSWRSLNLYSLVAGYDAYLFHLSEADKKGRATSTDITAGADYGPFEMFYFGGNEHDRAYVNGKDIGNAFVIFVEHILHHFFSHLCQVPDRTHLAFYAGTPSLYLSDFKEVDLNLSVYRRLVRYLKKYLDILLKNPQVKPIMITEVHAVEAPVVPKTAPKYDFSTPDKARYAVRVICDEEGLSLKMKNELCETVKHESGFNPKVHNINSDPEKTIDCGIAQLNTKWYLKPNNMTCQDAKDDPERCIRIMARAFKAGRQRDWIAYRKLYG